MLARDLEQALDEVVPALAADRGIFGARDREALRSVGIYVPVAAAPAWLKADGGGDGIRIGGAAASLARRAISG